MELPPLCSDFVVIQEYTDTVTSLTATFEEEENSQEALAKAASEHLLQRRNGNVGTFNHFRRPYSMSSIKHLPSYRVRRARCPIVIDGKLEELDWRRAERVLLQKAFPEPGDKSPLRARTRVASLWDDDHLYLAFEVEDREIWATLRERDARLFEEECVEFFLDACGDGRWYIETQINSLNTIRDLLVDAHIRQPSRAEFDRMALWHYQDLRSAVDIRHGWGWTLEIAIPWAEFSFGGRKFLPQPGSEMRVNFYRYERSRLGTEPLELSSWSEVIHSFHEPERFGRFVFDDEPLL
jgi:hypothetical protein